MAQFRTPASGPHLFGAGFGPLPGVNDLALPGASLPMPHGTSDLYTHDKPLALHPLRASCGNMPGLWRVPAVAEQFAAMREDLMSLVPLGRARTPERSTAYLNLAAQLPASAATRGAAAMIAAGPDDHEPLPALEENGGATPEADGEFSSTTPEMLYTELAHQLAHAHARLAGLHTQLAADVYAAYSAALDDLAQRLAHWQAALQELPAARGLERQQYADDIVIGERCLLDRLVRISADIFSEPIDEDATSGWGLRTRTRKPRATSVPRLRPTPTTPDAALPALVNHDIGFGPMLTLRPHQIADVNRFRGALRVVQDRVATLPAGSTLPVELLQGTVVLPVGGGKTLEMISCFAIALAEEWWKPQQGDKVIILNHTEQIHEQNLKVAQRLAPTFQQRTGRVLQISEYKAESKDCTGDVVVVSIPSVNTPERLAAFVTTLQAALGSTGHLALAAVDEIHHLELGRGKTKESWRAIIEALRKISPHLYRIGFTATPTGREGPYLGRLRELDLMRAGVTPRTYVVKVLGVDLSQLKVSEAAADFNTKQLVSTLLDFPERNTRLYQVLAQTGLRADTPSPSGRARLEGVLGFAADLRHAQMLARDYVAHFGGPVCGDAGDDLRARNVQLLGESRGRITHTELDRQLAAYRAGTADALVAIVSGETAPEVRAEILAAVERGEIEAVFNVDVWYEGADLYMFTHLLGARPTFSRFKKAQERGRVNRRGPTEVSAAGVLHRDPPKLCYDVIDNYHSFTRQLITYGTVMGVQGHIGIPEATLFDAMTEAVATGGVDRTGKDATHTPIGEAPTRPMPPRPTPEIVSLTPLIAQLWDLAESRYGRDLDDMAMDLGIPVESLEDLLAGKSWIHARWFLRRLATLLYQDRESLVRLYNKAHELGDDRVTPEDIDLLRRALTVVEQWGGMVTIPEETIESDEASRGGQALFSQRAIRFLSNSTITDRQWRAIWTGVFRYFEETAKATAEERAVEAWMQSIELLQALFVREGWEQEPTAPQEILRCRAREEVARRWGGSLPVNPEIHGVSQSTAKSPLRRWLAGEMLQYSQKLPHATWYSQVRGLLTGLGVAADEVEALIAAAVFAEQGWPMTATTPQEQLRFRARQVVTQRWGGSFPAKPAISGVPGQLQSPLSRWVAGDALPYSSRITPTTRYTEVRALLTGLGVAVDEVEALIEAAVFDERSWPTTAATPQERLRLRARQVVAQRWGGVLPARHGISGVPYQAGRLAPLTRWLGGETIHTSTGLSSETWYAQVRALLTGLGVTVDEVEALIEAAVFAEQEWPTAVATPPERLRLRARQVVARCFGMDLPRNTEIAGVSGTAHGSKSPIRRWLVGNTLRYSSQLTPMTLYAQVRALLTGLGVAADEVEALIEAAVFAERNWPTTAATPQERLRLRTRQIVAQRWGGVPPQNPEIPGVSGQSASAVLTRWLAGEALPYSKSLTPRIWYAQVRALLTGLGVNAAEVDALIAAAQREEAEG